MRCLGGYILKGALLIKELQFSIVEIDADDIK
jgi:hypothetical protein